jgi:hypothetical protein
VHPALLSQRVAQIGECACCALQRRRASRSIFGFRAPRDDAGCAGSLPPANLAAAKRVDSLPAMIVGRCYAGSLPRMVCKWLLGGLAAAHEFAAGGRDSFAASGTLIGSTSFQHMQSAEARGEMTLPN